MRIGGRCQNRLIHRQITGNITAEAVISSRPPRQRIIAHITARIHHPAFNGADGRRRGDATRIICSVKTTIANGRSSGHTGTIGNGLVRRCRRQHFFIHRQITGNITAEAVISSRPPRQRIIAHITARIHHPAFNGADGRRRGDATRIICSVKTTIANGRSSGHTGTIGNGLVRRCRRQHFFIHRQPRCIAGINKTIPHRRS